MMPNSFRQAALGAAAIALTASVAAAEPVTLKSYDGAVALTGDLVKFENNTYTLRTLIGEIAVSASQVACEGDACPEIAMAAEFAIKGSDTIGAALMPALLLGFADQLEADVIQTRGADAGSMAMELLGPDGEQFAKIDLASEGSSTAFRALQAGEAAIGMSSRQIRDTEIEKMEAAGFTGMTTIDREQVLALDGLAIIISPANPVDSLSTYDIADIFSGAITNWDEVGGPDMPITVLARDDQSGTYGEFESQILRPNGVELDPAAKRFGSNEVLSDEVAVTPGAIGFTGLAYIRSSKALAIRTECGLVATPDSFGIKTEEYPLARRLYLYTTGARIPSQADQLLTYAASDEAQRVIADAGFVDQGIDVLPVNGQGVRFAMAFTDPSPEFSFAQMRELMSELIAAQRLSTTFRFNPGSSQLDNKAQQDVARVVDYLMRPENKGREVLLVGFTDSVGRSDLNRALSFRRADQVRASIAEAGGEALLEQVAIRVLGYGELAPVGCNETLLGRSINRRVEVWLRDAV